MSAILLVAITLAWGENMGQSNSVAGGGMKAVRDLELSSGLMVLS